MAQSRTQDKTRHDVTEQDKEHKTGLRFQHEGELPVKIFLKLILLPTVKTRKNDMISLTEGGVMIIVKRA
ncbi:hypothetical protein BY996DRAFT_6480431 [Phakopsora pachyrhizi]|nr:hypothetical protein BY996DRAFT_6480431 [Phakopsora pachyrhizi]